jgi:hypothetical protein
MSFLLGMVPRDRDCLNFSISCLILHMLGGSLVTAAWRVLRLRRVAANILNKQSRTAVKGSSSSLGFGVGPTTLHRKNFLLLRNVSKRLGPGLILWHVLSNGKMT